jgi:hypothetical protein
VSFGDSPVDGNLRKVSHSGGPDESLDSAFSLLDLSRLQMTDPDVQERNFHEALSAMPRRTVQEDFVLSSKSVVKNRKRISTFSPV